MPKLRRQIQATIPTHGHTHAIDGTDPIPYNSIDRAQIKALGVFRVALARPPVGTGGQYGRPEYVIPDFYFKSIVPLAATLTWLGTFAQDETVTIRITAEYNDGTSASITRSATAPGSISLNPADLSELYPNNKYITRLLVTAASTAQTTGVRTQNTIYYLMI